MTYFTPVEPDTASGKAAELLAQVQKTLGSTPNMTKVMANSPTLLKSYLALFAAVATGTIPAAVRARLAIATAQLNGCEYCLSSHTHTLVPTSPKSKRPSLRKPVPANPTTHMSPLC